MSSREFRLFPGHKKRTQGVENRHGCGDGKKRSHTELEPDPAAHGGGDDGNKMVDGNSCGQGGGQFVTVVRDITDIKIGGKGGGADDRIQQEIGAHHPEGSLF